MSAYRKKLIEVALPLEAINRESAREKSIRHGHPSTLHLWWARRPLAACRAVLFASIVDDPSSRPEDFPTEEDQERERQRLFRIIEELVKWENSTNEVVLQAARAEILAATNGHLPPVLDPFCGGGSIPLEAQRLGLEAHASDLNPVAVLVTKALIEIPARFAGEPPINPESRARFGHASTWGGARGLAEDVRFYGAWIRDQAFARIGHLYPTVHTDEGDATVIAWLWARTVTCPNPACKSQMPLVRSFVLSKRKDKEWYVAPVVNRMTRTVAFETRRGKGAPEGTVGRRGARCIVCETPVPLEYVRSESRAGRMSVMLLAMVAEGPRGRQYLPPSHDHQALGASLEPPWVPDGEIPDNPGHTNVYRYGLTQWADLFTQRQLVALATFSGLVTEVRQRVVADGGNQDAANAISTYLALALDRGADYWSSICSWHSSRELIRNTFARQALPMVWDFAEANPFSESAGSFRGSVTWTAAAVEPLPCRPPGAVQQLDAMAAIDGAPGSIVCTDPPYYDNIGYADLSDLFYVWLRRSLSDVYPTLFSTLLTPKSQELVATAYRFGGDRKQAQEFFEGGLREAFGQMRTAHDPEFPLTLFYAFRQAESADGSISSTGWDTMLTGLLEAGFSVTGTWPVRSELSNRTVASGANALASSIVLVCRPRPADVAIATRRELISALRNQLPAALKQLQHGNIAPVDLAQAAIGPGMAIFSQFAKVLEADGTQMTVRAALGLINHALDEILTEQEGDFDGYTRFAVTWFEQRGFTEGPYGEADVLARAKDTSVGGLETAGILISRAGKVRLLRRDELPDDWDPVTDRRPTVWEATQHLAHRLDVGGEDAAADLLRRLGGLGETARALAYRLYTTAERKGWTEQALAYNALVVAWPEIARRVAGTPEAEAQQVLDI